MWKVTFMEADGATKEVRFTGSLKQIATHNFGGPVQALVRIPRVEDELYANLEVVLPRVDSVAPPPVILTSLE